MVAHILENTSIKKDEVFDFELSPFSSEFNDVFNFYNEAISRHAHYGIEPHLLFYRNASSCNAAAGKENDYYIISINAGTIVHLIEKFREQSIPLNAEYIDFESLLDVSVSKLMYDTALHFTFYHELGHLIQKSDLLSHQLYERPENDKEFSIGRHVLELDADTFSSLCLGTHLIQYAKGRFKDDLNSNIVKKLIVIACSSALIYLLSFQTAALPIYYEESTHPHPVVRISCIVFHIVGYCQQSLKEDGLELHIQEIVNEALSFTHSIISNGNDKSAVELYQAIVGQEADNITAYLKKMRAIQDADKTMSAYKWNQYILMRQTNSNYSNPPPKS